ncbi:MAG: diaminopimelate decarboxylase [Planctomycetes bacterium]|nr:diaminopimelate decarboxylase [Planctomycetota bacterium]
MIDDALLARLAAEHGTPLYVLDLDRVRAQVARLDAFDVVRYAQKAHPGLALLRALAADGLAVDATGGYEVERALVAGFDAARIELATDVLDRHALATVARHGVRVNLGSTDLIEPYAAAGGSRECTLRVNPGFGGGHSRRVTTGGPHSKHGIWHTELAAACARAQAAGLVVTGLHVHIGSGAALEELAPTLEAMGRLLRAAPASVARVSPGGGLPVPYRAEDAEFPVERYGAAWRAARDAWSAALGRPLELEVEPGRYLVAQAGTLVTEVRATKRTPAWDWVLVDAGFHTLARPMLYGAYHRIDALGRDGAPTRSQVVAGPLCEAGDVLTQDAAGAPRPVPLPELAPGDLLAVRDVGAYGLAMASNYNGFALPAEVLVTGGAARLVRRRQTLDDLLAPERDLDA